MADYRCFTIYPFPVKGRYRPILQNWRGSEPIKIFDTFETPEKAIAAAKAEIDQYFATKKGVVV